MHSIRLRPKTSMLAWRTGCLRLSPNSNSVPGPATIIQAKCVQALIGSRAIIHQCMRPPTETAALQPCGPQLSEYSRKATRPILLYGRVSGVGDRESGREV